jgi:VCBS repeat-containing protein
VVGSSDAAKIVGIVKGSVVEDTQLIVTEQLTITDIDDQEDKLAFAYAGKESKTPKIDIAQTPIIQGTYGQLALDPTGKWQYTLDNDTPAIQALYETDKKEDIFTILTVDGTKKIITIDITGQGKKITGTKNDDTLLGTDQEDSISGGAGSDIMIGGLGDDIYLLDIASDQVVELANEGVDTIQLGYVLAKNMNYVIPDHIENLTIKKPTTSVTLTGNSLDNTILASTGFSNDTLYGMDGNDILNGGRGYDTLDGGAGNDILYASSGKDLLIGGSGGDAFIFSKGYTTTQVADISTIKDFNASEQDTIALIATTSVFKELLSQAGSTLLSTQFVVGTKASNADHRVVYDQNSGYLYYDANGNASAKDDKKVIAILDNKAELNFDFANLSFTEWDRTTDNNAIMTQTV